MIPSHSVFLRELFIPIWGAGVTRQKKTEDRTRELRKKARRPSGQCKDGRARIKRTSTRETLPETTRRPRGWAPSARRTRQRLPRSFVQGATGTGERERWQLKARPGLARCRTRSWKELQALLPRHLRGAPNRLDGTAAKFLESSVLFPSVLARLRRGAAWSPNFGAPGLMPHLILLPPARET